MNSLTSIERLREIPGILRTPLEDHVWKLPSCPGGIPRGALTEIFGKNGVGRTQIFIELLKAHPELRAAWVEKELSFFPPYLKREGIDESRVLFVETGDELLWSVRQLLQSQLLGVVAIDESRMSFSQPELRRLQLLAHQSGTTLLLLRERPLPLSGWMIRKRIDAAQWAQPSFEAWGETG